MPAYSRYEDLPLIVYNRDNAGIQYRSRRFLPHGEDIRGVMNVEVRDGERMDLLANRTVGEPTLWWRLADANEVMDPFDLEEPGRSVSIPSSYEVNPKLFNQE